MWPGRHTIWKMVFYLQDRKNPKSYTFTNVQSSTLNNLPLCPTAPVSGVQRWQSWWPLQTSACLEFPHCFWDTRLCPPQGWRVHTEPLWCSRLQTVLQMVHSSPPLLLVASGQSYWLTFIHTEKPCGLSPPAQHTSWSGVGAFTLVRLHLWSVFLSVASYLNLPSLLSKLPSLSSSGANPVLATTGFRTPAHGTRCSSNTVRAGLQHTGHSWIFFQGKIRVWILGGNADAYIDETNRPSLGFLEWFGNAKTVSMFRVDLMKKLSAGS